MQSANQLTEEGRRRRATRRSAIYWAAAILLLVLGTACSDRQPPVRSELIRKTAERAKELGRTTADIPAVDYDIGAGVTLNDLLSEFSALVVEPDGPTVTSVVGDWIYTWHQLKVIERISTRPPGTHRPCTIAPPPSFARAPDHVVVPLLAGSISVDGVLLTMRSPEDRIRLDPQTRYLVFAQLCGNGVIRIPYGDEGVHIVEGPSGRLLVNARSRLPFIEELLNVRDRDHLLERAAEAAAKEP